MKTFKTLIVFLGLKALEIAAFVGLICIVVYISMALSFWSVSWLLLWKIIKWSFVAVVYGIIFLLWISVNWIWAEKIIHNKEADKLINILNKK